MFKQEVKFYDISFKKSLQSPFKNTMISRTSCKDLNKKIKPSDIRNSPYHTVKLTQLHKSSNQDISYLITKTTKNHIYLQS